MIKNKNYYLNDYFDLFNIPYNREKEYMKTDIYEKNNQYIIEIDLPGLTKDNIKVNYEQGYLSICANKTISTNIPYIRRERLHGEIKRSFYIGFKKESDIKASYKDGILNISFPKEDINKITGKNINIT